MTCDYPLRHGYTLNDVHRLARQVAATTYTSASIEDRYDDAFSAIAEQLYTLQDPPEERELVRLGRNVILTAMRQSLRHHGYAVPNERNPGGVGAGPRFNTYWEWIGRATPSPESRIVDETALRQILPCLTAKESAAVYALAAFGSYVDAAASLGLSYKQFCDVLRRARTRFFALWHEGESPSRRWGWDRRAGVAEGFDGRRTMQQMRARRRYAAGRS